MAIRWRRDAITRLREQREWSESELARQAGFHRQYLSYLLRRADPGGVQVRTIERLCHALSAPGRPVGLLDLIEVGPHGT